MKSTNMGKDKSGQGVTLKTTGSITTTPNESSNTNRNKLPGDSGPNKSEKFDEYKRQSPEDKDKKSSKAAGRPPYFTRGMQSSSAYLKPKDRKSSEALSTRGADNSSTYGTHTRNNIDKRLTKADGMTPASMSTEPDVPFVNGKTTTVHTPVGYVENENGKQGNSSINAKKQLILRQLREKGSPTSDSSTMEFGVESEIRIVLIGRTGSGKSATGNTILGNIKFESKVSALSVTSRCERGETIQAEKKVIVVDTPGLFDTGMKNEEVTKEIVKCISMTSPGPHAMVLVVGIGRFTKEEQDTVQHFVDYFGEGMLKYMIVLFTRQDDLYKANQSIDQYVDSVPKELKAILHQCGNRYVAFNNGAVRQTKREQVSQFFGMVDSMLTRNGGSYYTNELYKEAEATLQRRMHHQREILEKKKQQEKDEIIRGLEKEYEQKLEKIILEKSSLEEALKSTNIQDMLMNEMKTLQNQLLHRNNEEDRRNMEKRIESLQQQLHAVDKAHVEREKERLQRDIDESNRRHEKILKEKNKEIKEFVKRKDIEYESKMNSGNLRTRERDNIENENPGAIEDLIGGLKQIASGIWKAGKKLFSLF